MSFYPFNPNVGQQMQTDALGMREDRSFVAHLELSAAEAAAAATAGVHAAVTDNGAQQVIASGITNPPYPPTERHGDGRRNGARHRGHSGDDSRNGHQRSGDQRDVAGLYGGHSRDRRG